MTQGVDAGEVSEASMLHLIADNVDHNKMSLDGEGTIHWMGMVGAITPANRRRVQIARNTVTLEDIKKVGCHKIMFQRAESRKQFRKQFWLV